MCVACSVESPERKDSMQYCVYNVIIMLHVHACQHTVNAHWDSLS